MIFFRNPRNLQKISIFFSQQPPGIAGVVEIVKESYVDHTQFDKKDPHYDPKSKKEKPKWFMVDVKVCPPVSICF